MAKAAAKNEAARQELLGELQQLTADNLKQDGQPKKDAVPQELLRIEELKKQIANTSKSKPSEPASPAEPEPLPEGETTDDELKRLRKENKKFVAKHARSAEAAKIKQQGKKPGYVPRPDEIMGEALEDALDREPQEWDESNILAVEREIRRSVKKGGSRKNYKGDYYDIPAGFKKGIPIRQKVHALELLEKLGRLKGDIKKIIKMITDRDKKMSIAQQRQTAKEFNIELAELGVMWDDSIQIPGFSPALTT